LTIGSVVGTGIFINRRRHGQCPPQTVIRLQVVIDAPILDLAALKLA
jgi:hypothetical protein